MPEPMLAFDGGRERVRESGGVTLPRLETAGGSGLGEWDWERDSVPTGTGTETLREARVVLWGGVLTIEFSGLVAVLTILKSF